MLEHIVAVYPDVGAADAAEQDLRDAGIPANAVRRYSRNGSHQTEMVERPMQSAEPSGFWAWLLGEETSSISGQSDSDLFDRRAAQGDTVLSVTIADDGQIHRAVQILEQHGPIQIDEKTEEEPGAGQQAAPVGSGPAASGSMSASPKARDEVVPLAEEELEVGKRTVDRGTTRVRRYVVERPVERDVTLHGERVVVERRRPATDASVDAGAFEERIVEARETEEVPVVQKKAHVAEEVVIHHEATDRTEKVRDTVRREEVEVASDKAKNQG
jgi:uncharacterized protein (TIGR02271 family)